MAIELNHTLVSCTDTVKSSGFVTQLFGLPDAVAFGPFMVVTLSNGVSLDYVEASGPITRQHYAFLVSEEEFDAIFERIVQQGLDYWADPYKRRAGTINHNDGGRGVYFDDPDGHVLEIITRPYGGG